MYYVLVTRCEDLNLVGPFETNNAAANYGAIAQKRLWSDDPRWQTIKLTRTYGLRVESPDSELSIPPDAYHRACGLLRQTRIPETPA